MQFEAELPWSKWILVFQIVFYSYQIYKFCEEQEKNFTNMLKTLQMLTSIDGKVRRSLTISMWPPILADIRGVILKIL